MVGAKSPALILLLATLQTPAIAWTSPHPFGSNRFETCLKMTATTNVNNPKPNLPIPEPICSTTPGTWAYDTMSRRVDQEILQRTFEDNEDVFQTNEFKPILERFNKLRDDLRSSSPLTMLEELSSDASEERQREWNEWKEILQPFLDQKRYLAFSSLDGD